jgi:hypothetical protein
LVRPSQRRPRAARTLRPTTDGGNRSLTSQQGSKAVRDGVEVIQGTPTAPITTATLFLRLWRVREGKQVRTRATLFMVRPGATDYVIKELIPDMELDAQAALDKAIAIAKRGDAAVVYLNADLARIPKQRSALRA